jgi:hypothetical protein
LRILIKAYPPTHKISPTLSSRGAKRRGDLKTMIWVLLETDLIVGVLLGLISAFVILNAVKDLIFTE